MACLIAVVQPKISIGLDFQQRHYDDLAQAELSEQNLASSVAPTVIDTTTPTNPFNVPSCHSVELAGFEAIA